MDGGRETKATAGYFGIRIPELLKLIQEANYISTLY